MKNFVVFVFVVAACSLQSGCASIISGRNAEVAIDSYPSNAHVVIHDNDGRQVASLNTPGVVSLKRNRRYFLPARYTATIEAPGFAPAEVPVRSTVNPWVLGNVLFGLGGVAGLAVDNATGAAWMPRHSVIHSQLAPLGGPGQGPVYSANDPASQPNPPAANTPAQDARIVSRPSQSSPLATPSDYARSGGYSSASSSKAWIPFHTEEQERFAERSLESPNERIQAEGATARRSLY
jgi:hypothetical protein